jgi:hypothetical protein
MTYLESLIRALQLGGLLTGIMVLVVLQHALRELRRMDASGWSQWIIVSGMINWAALGLLWLNANRRTWVEALPWWPLADHLIRIAGLSLLLAGGAMLLAACFRSYIRRRTVAWCLAIAAVVVVAFVVDRTVAPDF